MLMVGDQTRRCVHQSQRDLANLSKKQALKCLHLSQWRDMEYRSQRWQQVLKASRLSVSDLDRSRMESVSIYAYGKERFSKFLAGVKINHHHSANTSGLFCTAVAPFASPPCFHSEKALDQYLKGSSAKSLDLSYYNERFYVIPGSAGRPATPKSARLVPKSTWLSPEQEKNADEIMEHKAM